MSVVPKKHLGQHFLVDENILGVIERLAELRPEDVVLEIGPGLGVLTRYLAPRVARVVAVELDASLEPHLRNAGANAAASNASASPQWSVVLGIPARCGSSERSSSTVWRWATRAAR